MKEEAEEEEEALFKASTPAWERGSAFCGRCGARNGGAEGASGRRACPRCGARVYPRTDPVALVLVASACGGFALLVSPKAMPQAGMFSCVSGFVEQGESAEAAGRREVLEEAGVAVDLVRLVSSQPWPRGRGGGCELMLGMVAEARGDGGAGGSGPPRVRVGEELRDAVWASREEVAEALGRSGAPESPFRGGSGGGSLWLPPERALAHELLLRWSEGGRPGASPLPRRSEGGLAGGGGTSSRPRL